MIIHEIRLTSAQDKTILETFIHTDESVIQDKLSEWHGDSWNRYCQTERYAWFDGVRTTVSQETIY